MKAKWLNLIVLLTLVLSMMPVPAQAGPLQQEPDNDMTPVYDDEGNLIYPLFPGDQRLGPRAASMSMAEPAAAGECGMPTPAIDPSTWGDINRGDNYARTAAASCEGKLVAQAWSIWAGRPPIHTDHDPQTLSGSWKVTDLTTGDVVAGDTFSVMNNPREQGVLVFDAEYLMPRNGHRYRIDIEAKLRQNRCRNGGGESSSYAEAVAPKPPPVFDGDDGGSCLELWINTLYSQGPFEVYWEGEIEADGLEVASGSGWLEPGPQSYAFVGWTPDLTDLPSASAVDHLITGSLRVYDESGGALLFEHKINQGSGHRLTCKVEIELSCEGANIFGQVDGDPFLEWELSDGQSGTQAVEGPFDIFIAWDPPIDGQYGPFEVWATAVLLNEGHLLSMASAGDTLTCGEPPPPPEPVCTVSDFVPYTKVNVVDDDTAAVQAWATWEIGPEEILISWDFGGRTDTYRRDTPPIPPSPGWELERKDEPYTVTVTFIVKEDEEECLRQTVEVIIPAKPEPPPTGSVTIDKIDENQEPWTGVTIQLLKDGGIVATGTTPVTFDGLELETYVVREIVPEGSEPMGPTEFEFTLDEEHLEFSFTFQNRRPEEPPPPPPPECIATDIKGRLLYEGNHMSGNPVHGFVQNLSDDERCQDELYLEVFGSNQEPESLGWLKSQTHTAEYTIPVPPGTIEEIEFRQPIDISGFCWYQVDLTRVKTQDPHISGDAMVDYVFVEGTSCPPRERPRKPTCPTCGPHVDEFVPGGVSISWTSQIPCEVRWNDTKGKWCVDRPGSHATIISDGVPLSNINMGSGITTPIETIVGYNGRTYYYLDYDGPEVGMLIYDLHEGQFDWSADYQRIRDVVGYEGVKKFSSCGITPGWWDTNQEGMAFFRYNRSHNVSEWAEFVRDEFGLDWESAVEWATELSEVGQLVLPGVSP